MEQRRIVLVEDDAGIRGLVRLHLEGVGPGWEVVGEFDSAEAAVVLAAHLCPDVIVLDNELAGKLTGEEAAPGLKAASPACRIVLYSASVPKVGAPLPGIDVVVSKTARLEELVSAVVGVSGAKSA
jgi:DNA-binding NarL/FixJ family response regulator